MNHSSHNFIQRFKYIVWGFVVAVSIILSRLFFLQIRDASRLSTLSERNFLRIEKICCPRGHILDCKGRPLATSRPVTSIYWQGTGKKHLDDDQKKLIHSLEKLLAKTIERGDIELVERSNTRQLLDSNVDFDILRALLEQYTNHKNLIFQTYFKREYPHKNSASHILGYLGSITTHPSGKMGLEKIYENELKGKQGQLQHTVNSRGVSLITQEIEKAQQGDNLYTTIDLDLQRIAEDIFPSEHAGVLLIMNPKNGALKTILSHPAFDPNLFVDSLSNETWQELQSEKQPFLNRAFSALYPPASLFKLVAMAAALDTNITTTDASWFCGGHTTFAGRRYHCWETRGHGTLTTMQAVALSCNIPFYEIGKHIKVDTLADYAHRFGLGCATGHIFPEKAGLIPTTSWKRAAKGERWWPGETLSVAIGQSFLQVTPIQMVRMIAGLCEGYLVTPCILQEEANAHDQEKKTALAISEKTREFLKSSLKQVVKRGTGQRLSRLGNIEIYAKTGTGQTCSLEKSEQGGQYDHHAWFIAHIQYKNYEPITLLIILENAGRSTAAIAVAKSFLTKYCSFVDKHAEDYEIPDIK